jgi:hypothetical protein
MLTPDKSFNPKSLESKELPPISTVYPPIESLLNPEKNNSFWAEKIKNDPELKKQAELRRVLSTELDSLFTTIPEADMEISQAIDMKLIDSAAVAKIYNDLSDLFQADKYNSRILLYLPLELIPSSKWKVESEELSMAVENFLSIYREKWSELLHADELRANFLDGDILEPEIQKSSLVKVAKAAHLTPFLIQKKLITFSEVLSIVQNSQDDTLKNSFADTISVLDDMNLLSQNNINELSASPHVVLRNMAVIVADNRKNPIPLSKETEQGKEKEWPPTLKIEIENELREIGNIYEEKIGLEGFPGARAKWEKIRDEEKIIEKYSETMGQLLTSSKLNLLEVQNFSNDFTTNEISALITIGGIRKSISNLPDSHVGQKEFKKFHSLFKSFSENGTDRTRDALQGALEQFLSLKVIDEKYLTELGLTKSDLEGEVSLEKIKKETEKIEKLAESIGLHPELSKFAYPVLIMFGSRIKGYGGQNADIDLALLIKPSTSPEERKNIEVALEKISKREKIQDNPIQFWLEEKEDGLKIKDFPDFDRAMGDSSLAQVFFQGVWCGKNEVIKELYEKFLSGYLYSKNKKINGEDARKAWLEEIERATLQYRLMHKGYARFHPSVGGIKTEHSDSIDSGSAFWDSGYRRLATKLFLKRVFLPQLEK